MKKLFCAFIFLFSCFVALPQNIVMLKYKKYIVLYDTTLRVPLYTYYVLNGQIVKQLGKYGRQPFFSKDKSLKSGQASSADYDKSGYDKGHMVPAEDMSYDSLAETQCFYFTNIVPQDSKLNRGQWKALEEYTRKKAANSDSILIITGAFSFKSGIKLNKTCVPDSLFKIIYDYKTQKEEIYVVPNKPVVDYRTYKRDRFFVDETNYAIIPKK